MADNTVIRANTAVFTKLPQAIERDVRLSQHGSLVTTQAEPKYAELARARVLYGANNGSAVGLANVAAIPTTTASYALYNGSTSKHAVVLKISVMVTTITAPTEFGLIAGLSPTAQAAAETKYSNSAHRISTSNNGVEPPEPTTSMPRANFGGTMNMPST